MTCIPEYKIKKQYIPKQSFLNLTGLNRLKPPCPMDLYYIDTKPHDISLELMQWNYERDLLQVYNTIFKILNKMLLTHKTKFLNIKADPFFAQGYVNMHFNYYDDTNEILPLIFNKHKETISYYYEPRNFLKELEECIPINATKNCLAFHSYLYKKYYFYKYEDKLRVDGLTEEQKKQLQYGYD